GQGGFRRLDNNSAGPGAGNSPAGNSPQQPNGNWRRLEGPSVQNENPRGNFPRDNNNGFRQNAPSVAPQAPQNGAPQNGIGGGNWRRLDGPSANPSESGSRGNFPRENGGGFRQAPQAQPAPQGFPRQFGGGERPVQINPPIVRQRPDNGGASRNFGGFG